MASFRLVPVLLVCGLVIPVNTLAQTPAKLFQGIYVGIDVGVQNIIGGAQVAGVDVLQQDTRAVISVPIGGRVQLADRIVLGVEFAFGFEDGDLQLVEPLFTVDYRNNRHWRLGGTFGYVVGLARRTLLMGYVAETTRTFDVTITTPSTTFSQQDEQGLLRYGAGVEQNINQRLSIRGTVGTSRADFGDQQTNITPDNPLEFAVGLNLRF